MVKWNNLYMRHALNLVLLSSLWVLKKKHTFAPQRLVLKLMVIQIHDNPVVKIQIS